VLLDKSGAPDLPIRYLAFPGERPVFDFFGYRPQARIRGISVVADHRLIDAGTDVGTMKTHFLGHRGIRTAYLDSGPAASGENAVPFVLVHGFTGGKLDFQDQLPWFSEGRRVLALDQRGHGESSNLGSPDAYGIEIQSADLQSFLDALGIRRCHLLGHSMGGMVAMRFALGHPDHVASLVLMDTTGGSLSLGRDSELARTAERVRERGCQVVLERSRAAAPGPGVQPGIDFLGEVEHWRRIQWKLEHMDPEAFVCLMTEMKRHSVLAEVHRIACPTTVLAGEFDRPFLEPSAALAKEIPGSRWVTIPGAAHCPQYENARGWTAAVQSHLAWASGSTLD
jgi:pimeloyl-ACP methyl ester carboxylesterase